MSDAKDSPADQKKLKLQSETIREMPTEEQQKVEGGRGHGGTGFTHSVVCGQQSTWCSYVCTW